MKALALISGGLDSMLAAKVILEQSINIEGITFNIGFGHVKQNKHRAVKDANWAAQQLNIKLHQINVIEEFKPIVLNPKHGYGAHLNPCLDCKIFMVHKALEFANQNGFDFLITGEVVGQRPKSQRKKTMCIVSNESEAHDRLLRPLCAKHFPLTYPEKMGWVDREKLFDFSGRSRTPQIQLAKSFGFDEFPQPAGGCLLTEKHYSKRLLDLWNYRENKNYTATDITLLKIGRHLRPKLNFKLIIARNESDWILMEPYRHQFISLETTSHLGPLVLIDGIVDHQDIEFSARITAAFSAGKKDNKVTVQITDLDHKKETVRVTPWPLARLSKDWYI